MYCAALNAVPDSIEKWPWAQSKRKTKPLRMESLTEQTRVVSKPGPHPKPLRNSF